MSETASEDTAAAIAQLQQDFDQFTIKWALVVEQISSALETLTVTLQATPTPNYVQAITSLQEWIESAMEFLKIPDLLTVEREEIMHEKAGKLRELREEMHELEDSVRFIQESASELIDAEGGKAQKTIDVIDNLLTKWTQIKKSLNSSMEILEARYKQLADLDKKMSELGAWMDEVEQFLVGEQPAVGDQQALQAQLQQSKGLIEDIKMLQPKVEKLNQTATELSEFSSSELAEELQLHLKRLNMRWNETVSATEEKHHK